MKKEPIAGIYRFTNKLNGKAYIGQAVNIEKRKKYHLYCMRTCRLPHSEDNFFHRALRKYGEDNFAFDILETFLNISSLEDKEAINRAERVWIERLHTMAPDGYNLKSGGGAVCDLFEYFQEPDEGIRKSMV